MLDAPLLCRYSIYLYIAQGLKSFYKILGIRLDDFIPSMRSHLVVLPLNYFFQTHLVLKSLILFIGTSLCIRAKQFIFYFYLLK